MRTLRPGWTFYGWLAIALLLTFVAHEAAHWAMGRALGYEMAMSLNGAAPAGGFRTASDAFWTSAAGPAFTVLQALVAYCLARCRDSVPAFAFLYAAAFMRFAAAVISLVHPNDEARMSLALGWGPWLLPGLVVALLLALVVSASRRLCLGWKTQVASYLLCSAGTAVIVFVDAA